MSLFNWFGNKSATPPDTAPDSGAMMGDEHTQPMSGRHHGAERAAPESNSARKQERIERREALYRVVRECMTQVGVLSSTYKFKVLSLDSHGRQYLIMIDIPQIYAGDPARFSEIEGLIARNAKAQHEILVTAVYWRISELVRSTQPAPANAQMAVSAAATLPATAPVAAAPVAAKAAMPVAAATTSEKVAALDLLFNNPPAETPTDFQDTQVDEHTPELGKTQYGDLN